MCKIASRHEKHFIEFLLIFFYYFFFKFDEEFLNRQAAESELAKCEGKVVELQAELEGFRTQVKDSCYYVLLFFIGSGVGALLFNRTLSLLSNDSHFFFHYEMVFLFWRTESGIFFFF